VRSLVVIGNPQAGAAGHGNLAAVVAAIARRHPVRLVDVHDRREVRRALHAKGRVVIAGGDGTVHAVLQRAHAAGALDRSTFAIVPLGTGNDTARGLGIPLDPIEAAGLAVDGIARRADLLLDDRDRIVVNMAHAGAGAVAAERADSWKERLGRVAYPLGALTVGVHPKGWRLRVAVDGSEVVDDTEPALLVAVANGPCLGGGAPLVPPAVPDDGVLDVVVVHAGGPVLRASLAAGLRTGGHLDHDGVLHARGRRVEITGEPVPYDDDGEIGVERPGRTLRVLPGAWRVVRPR
jgi:YegS/Rv2252/BmrU family lipid kinase